MPEIIQMLSELNLIILFKSGKIGSEENILSQGKVREFHIGQMVATLGLSPGFGQYFQTEPVCPNSKNFRTAFSARILVRLTRA